MSTVKPFSIHIPDSILQDLAHRLQLTRWPDEVENADWDYGTNLAYMQELTVYWKTQFNWRTIEAKLNAFPHFMTKIDGADIHFIHVRGKGPNPLPLIMSHGWPSSFVEMLKIIPMLTDPERFGKNPAHSFDIIVPSLPGFGFSTIPH